MKTLCTCWEHPETGQILVCPGNRRSTRAIAQRWAGTTKRLKAKEEMWSDKKLAALPPEDLKQTHNGIPPRSCHGRWRAVLERKERTFIVGNDKERVAVLTAAKRLGIKITSRKQDGTGYKIWKL